MSQVASEYIRTLFSGWTWFSKTVDGIENYFRVADTYQEGHSLSCFLHHHVLRSITEAWHALGTPGQLPKARSCHFAPARQCALGWPLELSVP